jgi:hypothetical protein
LKCFGDERQKPVTNLANLMTLDRHSEWFVFAFFLSFVSAQAHDVYRNLCSAIAVAAVAAGGSCHFRQYMYFRTLDNCR